MTSQEFLRQLMERHKDNPNSLSRKSGVPQSTIFRFLTGTAKEPRLSTFEKIARTYGVPVEAFLSKKVRDDEDSWKNASPPRVEEPIASSELVQWPFDSFSYKDFSDLPDLYKGRVEQAALAVIQDWNQKTKSA